jgi:hypothetical protein
VISTWFRRSAVLCPLEVEGEEMFEDLVVGDVVRPAVGVEDGFIQFAVNLVEPIRALVIEFGKGPVFQLSLGRSRQVEPIGPATTNGCP